MVNALISLGIPADKWRSGGVASSLLTVMATMLALTSTFIAQVISGFFLPLSTGDVLVLLARYMYGVIAPGPTVATGFVTIINSGGASYTKTPGQLTFLNPDTKQTYINTNTVVIPPLTTVINVDIQCTVVGTAGNAEPNTVDQFVNGPLGLTVTNPTAVLGSDGIDDASLRSLCLASLAANSPYGPRTAYQYAIQTATNNSSGNPVDVNRWLISPASPTGIVSVVVASPDGPVTSDDLVGIATSIEAKARPDTVTVLLYQTTTIPYLATITVYCKAPVGVSTAAMSDAIETALDTLSETYPIGGESAEDDLHPASNFTGLFKDAVVGAIASGVSSLGGQLISTKGATDLGLSATQTWSNGTTLTINIIPTIGGS
jgi:hypothetical protein